jgi:tetratricopeptide (TPR) repeat protein
MITSLKHSASIEQYLADEMSASEKEAFKKELRSNPELSQELKLSQTIDSAISNEDIIDLRKKILIASESNKSISTPGKIILMNTRKWWYAAASVIVLLAVSATLFLQTRNTITNDSLFSQYYNSENIIDQTRGDQNILEAVIKFQEKDFATASVLFKNIMDKDNSNIAVWFYYGIANIETKHYENSITAFNTIIKQNDNLYIEHAEWYLGLCYLKNNQKDKAIDQFMTVASDPDNIHKKEAKNILEKLQLK